MTYFYKGSVSNFVFWVRLASLGLYSSDTFYIQFSWQQIYHFLPKISVDIITPPQPIFCQKSGGGLLSSLYISFRILRIGFADPKSKGGYLVKSSDTYNIRSGCVESFSEAVELNVLYKTRIFWEICWDFSKLENPWNFSKNTNFEQNLEFNCLRKIFYAS